MAATKCTLINTAPTIRLDMAAASLEASRLFFKVQSKESASVQKLAEILSQQSLVQMLKISVLTNICPVLLRQMPKILCVTLRHQISKRSAQLLTSNLSKTGQFSRGQIRATSLKSITIPCSQSTPKTHQALQLQPQRSRPNPVWILFTRLQVRAKCSIRQKL